MSLEAGRANRPLFCFIPYFQGPLVLFDCSSVDAKLVLVFVLKIGMAKTAKQETTNYSEKGRKLGENLG